VKTGTVKIFLKNNKKTLDFHGGMTEILLGQKTEPHSKIKMRNVIQSAMFCPA